MIDLKTLMKPTTITNIATYQNSVIAYDTYQSQDLNLILSYSFITNAYQ